MERKAASASLQSPFLYHPFLPAAPAASLISTQTLLSPTMTPTIFSDTSMNTKHSKVSNFSINRILDNSSPETALVSADSSMFGSSAAAAASLPVALHHQHKSLIDAAKMIWLHQQLAAQQNHHRLIQANTGSLARHYPDHLSLHPKKFPVTKKRKLGRNPRIPFTQEQINSLEKKYCCSKYLSSLDVVALSKELELSEARVKIWFQNRRARERRDKKTDSCPLLPSHLQKDSEVVRIDHSPLIPSCSFANIPSSSTNTSQATISNVFTKSWKCEETSRKWVQPSATTINNSSKSAETTFSGLPDTEADESDLEGDI